MWVGDPNFEARGCTVFAGVQLEAMPLPACSSNLFCTGKVSCYFIHRDKLRNISDWASITIKYSPGIDTWIRGETGVLT